MHAPEELAPFATKIHVPHLRRNAVVRPRLLERLDAGLRQGRRLTLVAAPAGFGKSTLLATWLSAPRPGRPAFTGAWLALDGDDGDPMRFVTYLVAALQHVLPALGQSLLPRLQGTAGATSSGGDDPAAWPVFFVSALLQEIEAERRLADAPLVLVLDDYHEAATSAVDRLVTLLLEHGAPGLHIAIATRTEPSLPVARLRARGQMTEIGIGDLRFTPDEAARFLDETMELPLTAGVRTVLLARTEGWAAGLQLAALSLRTVEGSQATEFAADFDGSDRFVADYLLTEVIQGQPEEQRAFLLRTSILRRMCASLCAAVMSPATQEETTVPAGALELAAPRSDEGLSEVFGSGGRRLLPARLRDAQRLLEACERQNLFLIPLDHQRFWYRYHHLFAGLLQARLQRDEPELPASLHRRAGDWYARAGDAEEAMHHLLAIPDHEAAADLAQQFGVHMVGGSRLLTFMRWGERLGENAIRRRPFLCAGFGWVHVLTGQVQRALAYVEAGEAGVDDFPGLMSLPDRRHIAKAEVRGHLYAVRAYAARLNEDLDAVARYSHAALAELPADADTVRCTLALNLGLLEMEQGHSTEALAAFVEAHASGSRNAANLFVAISALALQGDIHVRRGRLDLAEQYYTQAIAEGEAQGAQPPPATGMGHLGLAFIHLQRGDFNAAGQQLDAGMRHAEQIAFAEGVEELLQLRTALAVHTGRRAEAAALLTAAELRLRNIDPQSPLHRRWATLSVADALGRGDLKRAAALADASGAEQTAGERPTTHPHTLDPNEQLMLARVRLAQGQAGEALRLLGAMDEDAPWLIRCEATCLAAQSRLLIGDAPGARRMLADAVAMAAPQGVRLPFLAAVPLGDLLRTLAAEQTTATFIGSILQAQGADATPESRLVDPLSERELAVLRLMAAGLTNAQIAATLVVAPSTVKTHANHILAKLSAQNRTQAVALAREQGLLAE